MNKYVDELESRAPALFWDDNAYYTGKYFEPIYDTIEDWGKTFAYKVEVRKAQIQYTVTNNNGAEKDATRATITVPLYDVVEFETALNDRISQVYDGTC